MRGTLPSAIAVIAAGFLLSACGAETRENAQRPPLPTTVSVTVSKKSIEVTPRAVGVRGQSPVNINQNRTAPENQANPEDPLLINVAVSNLVPVKTELVIEGPSEATQVLTANGSAGFNRALPAGIYRFSSPASSGSARLLVGPGRISASADLLTP